MAELQACIDRKPPPKTDNERLALITAAKWQPGDSIRVGFLDGDPDVQARVEQYAQIWTEHADLRLFFGDDEEADIRISFQDRGSWSYIGTQCREIPAGQATMNYGWLTPDSSDSEVSRVVLHEFGHALGAIHEHQNPAGGINWNKEAVYEYYAGSPNFWSREQVDHNLFETYSQDLTVYTDLDRTSIMMYPIPKEFTLDGFEVGLNTELSETDRQFIRQQYS
jgi:hypothetical protein